MRDTMAAMLNAENQINEMARLSGKAVVGEEVIAHALVSIAITLFAIATILTDDEPKETQDAG